MFKLRQKPDLKTVIRGIWLATPIKYQVVLPSGKTWADFFGHYQNQRWGIFDTDSCWFLGGSINELEDELELLKGGNGLPCQFSDEAMKFFTDNGYIDADGDFSLSERFGEIMGGLRRQGGLAETAAQLNQKYGCIPRSMLTYTIDRVNMYNGDEQAIENDYFNPAAVTPEMLALGQQFRKYVNIAYQNIGTKWQTPDLQTLRDALKQAPLSIGIPIPADVSLWNNSFVKYDGGRNPAHEVELYDIDANGQYMIFDQYEPHLKVLSADYYIPYCTQIIAYPTPVVIPNPVPQNSLFNDIMTAIHNFWNKASAAFTFKTP